MTSYEDFTIVSGLTRYSAINEVVKDLLDFVDLRVKGSVAAAAADGIVQANRGGGVIECPSGDDVGTDVADQVVLLERVGVVGVNGGAGIVGVGAGFALWVGAMGAGTAGLTRH